MYKKTDTSYKRCVVVILLSTLSIGSAMQSSQFNISIKVYHEHRSLVGYVSIQRFYGVDIDVSKHKRIYMRKNIISQKIDNSLFGTTDMSALSFHSS